MRLLASLCAAAYVATTAVQAIADVDYFQTVIFPELRGSNSRTIFNVASFTCASQHIDCDEAGLFIEAVQFATAGLTGVVSGKLSALTKLQVIRLPGNELTGTLPPELRHVRA